LSLKWIAFARHFFNGAHEQSNARGNIQLSPFRFIALLDLLTLCLRKPRVKRLDGFRLRDHRISDDVH